jgi:hypothetical protein
MLLFRTYYGDTPYTFLDFTMFLKDKDMGYFGYDSLYPYKLLTSDLFEPFGNEVVHEVYDNAANILLVYKVTGVFDRIRLRTASDFLWNPANYDADLSLYKALVAEFGPDDAELVLEFNDLYFKVRSELIIASDPSTNTRHYLRKIANLIARMKQLQKQMGGQGNSGVRSELNETLDNFVNELEQTMNNMENSLSSN